MGRILLIEDDPERVRQLRASLDRVGSVGWDVDWRDGVDAGVELVRGGEVEVVLLDLGLREPPGIVALQELLDAAPDVPVIGVVDPADSEIEDAAFRNGAVEVFRTGRYTEEDLHRAVRLAAERFRRVRNRAARRWLRRAQSMLDALPLAAAVVAADGRLRLANRGWSRIAAEWGAFDVEAGDAHERHGWLGQLAERPPTGLAAEDVAEMVAGIRQVLDGERAAFDVEFREAGDRWLQLGARPLADGRFRGAVLTLSDVSTRRRLEDQLDRRSYHDPLTGLGTRRLLEEKAAELLALADRAEERVGVAYVDLRRFSVINDTLGHTAGDRVLQSVARRFGDTLRESDVVGRVGGDELAVLFTRLLAGADADRVARRILAIFEEPFHVDGHTFHVEANVGVALHPEDGENFAELLDRSDRAMRRSRQEAGSAYRLFRSDVGAGRDLHRLDWEEALQRALARGELEVWYQPISPLHGDEVRPVAAEALIRWRHPEEGVLPAGRFLGMAEELGLMRKIDRRVIRLALETLAGIPRSRRPAWLGINLAPVSLGDTATADFILRQLDERGLRGEEVMIEVREDQVAAEPARVAAVLETLREAGVRIALDDYGTRWSSLEYLRRFPADVLKLDRSLVEQIGRDRKGEDLLEAVLVFGRSLGLLTLAEGVEEAGQRKWLAAAGCDLVQGYRIGRPAPTLDLDPGDGDG